MIFYDTAEAVSLTGLSVPCSARPGVGFCVKYESPAAAGLFLSLD